MSFLVLFNLVDNLNAFAFVAVIPMVTLTLFSAVKDLVAA